jgi:hypothetical protein
MIPNLRFLVPPNVYFSSRLGEHTPPPLSTSMRLQWRRLKASSSSVYTSLTNWNGPHRQCSEEDATVPLKPQESEEIWLGTYNPHKCCIIWEHPVGLYHHLIQQLHRPQPQGSPEGGAVCPTHPRGKPTCPTGHLQHPISQEGQKDHQGQQPPEPLPVHPTIIQKARSEQVH